MAGLELCGARVVYCVVGIAVRVCYWKRRPLLLAVMLVSGEGSAGGLPCRVCGWGGAPSLPARAGCQWWSRPGSFAEGLLRSPELNRGKARIKVGK